jgi:hypothetical protein
MIVKMLDARGETRLINTDSIQDDMISNEVSVFFAQDDETANTFTFENAAPLLDALKMLADETARKHDFHKSTRSIVLPVIIGLLLASLACTLTDGVPATLPLVTETAIPEGTATMLAPRATSTPDEPGLGVDLTPETATPDTSVIVCFTNDYDGLVRVRECGGLDCHEIAILPAGTRLIVAETMTNETGNWARIASPIEGWLNARYICAVE